MSCSSLGNVTVPLVRDDLDKELARRGHRFCRYADDCNILFAAVAPANGSWPR